MLLLLLTMTLFNSGLQAFEHTYGIGDLEVLAGEGSFKEFFKHALDVKPSERNETWKALTLKMAEGYSKDILSRSSVAAEAFGQTEELYGWPVLRTDAVFRSRRREIGVRYLTACLKSPAPCWEIFKNFWEADKSDSDTAIRLAELVVKHPKPSVELWELLEGAVKSPLSEFYCKRDFVLAALWEKFELDYVRLGPAGDLLTKIDGTVHHDCLPALNAEAQRRLLGSVPTGQRELAFQILKAQGKTTEALADFFHTVYLLERPSQGELFNLSWNRLRFLGKSKDRRDRVMESLKRLDPLPDEILGSVDPLKKRVVLQHFKANFPEYLDHYYRQCLSYYSGKGEFPKGNPTLGCKDFMTSDLAPALFDREHIDGFQATIRL